MRRLLLFGLALMLAGCSTNGNHESGDQPAGKLFIIGGGKRPLAMMQELAGLAQLDKEGAYAVVLPMASAEPDTSFYYLVRSFGEDMDYRFAMFNFADGNAASLSQLDSLRNAALVYMTGGDQNKFMQIVLNTPVHEAIMEAYRRGAVVAGTSAGAAVQSRKMITGNELKYPEYTGNYRTIEAENIEISEGLGLLQTAIIDQHFVWRMRMNRLIAAAIENPGELLIGIDESTAIVVSGDTATVTGNSQVVVLHNKNAVKRQNEGLLGSEGMVLSVYLPGERFLLKP